MSSVKKQLIDYSSFDVQLEDLLQRLCESLQLSDSHYAQAITSYNAVAKWIQGDQKFADCHLEVYPQGSVRIGTTVKPTRKQEFDVDLVLEIHAKDGSFKNPIELLDLLEKRMNENDTYKGMIERKNRCIQIQYANQYHLDILPAIPTNVPVIDSIKVPDCETQGWKPSNPKGYAQWFEDIAENFVPLKPWQLLFEKSASAEIESLPDQEEVHIKPPLKRAVQLIKHFRNRYFENQDVKPPISIVLTTLAAQFYEGQGSVYLAISAILDGVTKLIESSAVIKVYNPKNPGELLSERWEKDPEQYLAFKRFILAFREHWSRLPGLEGAGMISLNKSLGEMFDPTLVQNGFQKQAQYQQALRQKGMLGMTGMGQVAAATAAPVILIPKNTFYGS